MARVILTDFVADDLTPERQVLQGVAEITALNAHNAGEIGDRLADADAVIGYHLITFDKALLERMPKARVLARGGVGFDNVDIVAARELGIPVVNVPDYGTEEVADTAIALMLGLVRGVHLYANRLQRGLGPWTHTPAKPLTRLRGRTFGVVGLGRIGTAAALRAKALGMTVAFFDPLLPDGIDKSLGVHRCETLADLLGQSFVVSCHCPLTDTTRNLIDAAAIASMPRGSYLINTSRGAVVDTAAIPAAIRSGHLAGAGIDVFAVEPPPEDHPLLSAWRNPDDPCHDRVIITPHAAFYSEEGLLDIRRKTAEACRRAILGLPLRNVVN